LNKFRFHINKLFVWKKREELFELLTPNLDKAFNIWFHKNFFQKLRSKYCRTTLSVTYEDDLFFEWETPAEKSLFFRAKEKTYNAFFLIKKCLINVILCKNIRYFFQPNFVLEDVFSEQFIDELAINNEALWYDIIRNYINRSSQHWKEFYKKFLTRIFTDIRSTTSYQLSELDYEKEHLDNDYLIMLTSNSWSLELIKNMDISVRKILYDPLNHSLLNQEYYPGSDYNNWNRDLVIHIWRLFRIIEFVDIDSLFLSNTPMYLAKDLMKVTDRSKYQEWISEYTTGTYYLLSELLDIIENVCDKKVESLSVYFGMIKRVLNFDEVEVPSEFKQTIAHSSMYFLSNEFHITEKNQQMKKLLTEYPSLKVYYNLSPHDQITFSDRPNESILEIINN